MERTLDIAREFGGLFRSFQRTAFRLETLPEYRTGSEDESIRRFLAGEDRPQATEKKQAWVQLIRSHAAAGRRMGRVHLIRGDSTDYLRWEIQWGYLPNAEAGEDIRILQVGEGELPELGTEDFWLFDDERAVRMLYRPNGQWPGQAILTDEPAVIAECKNKRDLALSLAVPLGDYLKEHA